MISSKEKPLRMLGECQERMLVALDIGTSKIAVLVALVCEEGLKVLGLGTHPSRGMKKGVVVDMELMVQSIAAALDEAQQMAGCRIYSAYVGIAGSHINGLNSEGVVGIHGSEVSASDIDRVLDSARAVALPSDQRVLHTIRWVCVGFAWKRGYTWSLVRVMPRRTSKNALNAAALWSMPWCWNLWHRPLPY